MRLKRLFIHAPNVHQGGGKSLLIAIVNSLPNSIRGFLCLDSRLIVTSEDHDNVLINRVTPSILKRFLAEKWLADNVVCGDVVLCFGNLPPLFRLDGRVVVYVQNRYLVDDIKLDGFSIKTKLRFIVERAWLFGLISNVNEFIVQTPSMKKILDKKIKNKIQVRVMPFVDNCFGYVRDFNKSKVIKGNRVNFLYVASGEPHKNHKVLIEAWILLAKEGFYPSLQLTLDKENFAELSSWIDLQATTYDLQVKNKGNLTHSKLKVVYKQVSALIYPSLAESLGLPLIEARQAGLPVLASELDYVRDVLDPEQVFDPRSPVSISRAVKRFAGFKELSLPLNDARSFVDHLLGTDL
jgi:glycosyltransferase involved in cell wall biosynthesis